MQYAESVPSYEKDQDGINALESILEFVKNDNYYSTFAEKAAYLFCSVANRHAFGNGNKRLSATLLRYFLADNHVKTIEATADQWKDVMQGLFPSYAWKSVDLGDAFYLLLYNLAFVAADGQLRPGISFDACKGLLTALFEKIFDVPKDC
ncbi:MAG: Fic family protein [Candidatus Peribacteraceae bacterium]|nr:Fic family protein [Candidatus Peribacteraceae bacterium]